MVKILHFADAHIDITNYGRHDPQSGLPVRVMDFLKSLDTIVDAALEERVDLVLFAGDAFKDRNPAPTFQREWGRRIMRLSRAGIYSLLLVGNHDLSPALNRAHAMEAFDTLEVPQVRVLDRPTFLTPGDLNGLPVQIMALPWIGRSGLAASLGDEAFKEGGIYENMAEKLVQLVEMWLNKIDPSLPVILMAHCSVQGAVYGGERMVMLGSDLVLPGSLVCDPRLDYVALGHIHKAQNLNENLHQPLGYDHPPVVYPGSIERVDFGEAGDRKYYLLAKVDRGRTELEWRELTGVRPFIDRFLTLKSPEAVTEQLIGSLPAKGSLQGCVTRLVVEYPREWETLIDDAALYEYTSGCLEFHLVKRPQVEARVRIPNDQTVGSLTPLELLDLYWRSNHTNLEESKELNRLAAEVIHETEEHE